MLTRRPRAPLTLGETTFHVMSGTPDEALASARQLAGDADLGIGGGPTVARRFLAAGLVDRIHTVIVPIVLGRGVHLWDGLEGLERYYEIESARTPSGVTHVIWTRRAQESRAGGSAHPASR